MAIVIKEIILSDNLEKFMEKVNFNFDQLLLAGGGPPGPIGPIGLIGPAGPKGDPGNKWYVGPSAYEPIGVTYEQGDLFLASGDGGNIAGITGEVYEWDNTGNQFDDTLLNLIGPTGPSGIAGSNLGWNAYGGATQGGVVYIPSTLGVLGATANFHFLKGDTSDLPGTIGISLDTLWLGGLTDAQASLSLYPLGNLPKIFIAPRTTFDSEDGSNQGLANSGIALGKDSGSGNLDNASPDSFSNIFIDTNMNLRITNFTNFTAAAGLAAANNTFIESMNNITLIGGGYYGGTVNGISPSTIASSQIGAGLTGITGWNANPAGIINISDGGAQQVIQNELGSDDLFRIIGGGAGTHTTANMQGGDPSVQLSAGGINRADGAGYYSISIAGRDVTDFTATGASYGRIIAGYNTAYYGAARDWIGLATYSGVDNKNKETLTAIDTNIHIGPLSTIARSNITGPGWNLNVDGLIRMTLTSVPAPNTQIITNIGNGTMAWRTPDIAGIPTGTGTSNQLTYWSGSTTQAGASGATFKAEWDPNNDGTIGLQYQDTNEGIGKVLVDDGAGNGNVVWGDADGTKVTIFNASGPHVIDDRTKSWDCVCIAGGGGGGGGAWAGQVFFGPKPFGMVTGGGGGQGGGMSKMTVTAAKIGPGSALAVTVGTGGAGGLGRRGPGSVPYRDIGPGIAGAAGTNSYISDKGDEIIIAYGGYAGDGGVVTTAQTSIPTTGVETLPGRNLYNQNREIGLGGLGTEVNPVGIPSYTSGSVSGFFAENMGGGYAGYQYPDGTYNLLQSHGADTMNVPTGGGLGRTYSTSNNGALWSAYTGGVGGKIIGHNLLGGLVGAIGAPGGDGQSAENYVGTGGGGGGSLNNVALCYSPSGGDGGLYGGGGGGGSARTVVFDTMLSCIFDPGAGTGGNGADGIVVIIEHF